MQLGYRSPWDKDKPSPFQQKFLTAAFRPVPPGEIAVTHGVGGRGVAKTSSLIMVALHSAYHVNPGLAHLWSAPTADDCTTNFLVKWQRYIPQEMYDLKRGDRVIYVYNPTGTPTPIFYRGRDISNQGKERRGQDWAAILVDEPRQDPTDKEWRAMLPSLRDPDANHLMLCTASTPRMNWYYDVVMDGVNAGRAVEIRGTSWDNPFNSRGAIDESMAHCDDLWARQEHYGEWVSLSNLAWDNANLNNNWPEGNMHPHGWDPSLEYILACDLGVRSGWLLIQTVPGHSALINSPVVDVVVAQYTPNHGNSQAVARDIHAAYGEPKKIIVGNDVNTRSITDGGTSSLMFRNMGWSCPIVPVSGKIAAKDTQFYALRACLKNALGHRTLCISRKLITYEPNHRGIEEVLRRDSWPDGVVRSGQFLPKDKQSGGVGLEDIRDAMMYWAVVQHPVRAFGPDRVRRAS